MENTLTKNNRAKEQSNNPFKKMLINKYPEIDIYRAVSIFNEKHAEIISAVLSEKKLPLDCDLNKHLFVAVLEQYLIEKGHINITGS